MIQYKCSIISYRRRAGMSTYALCVGSAEGLLICKKRNRTNVLFLGLIFSPNSYIILVERKKEQMFDRAIPQWIILPFPVLIHGTFEVLCLIHIING